MRQPNALSNNENTQDNVCYISAESDNPIYLPDALEFSAEDIKEATLEGGTLIVTLNDGLKVSIDNFQSLIEETGKAELKLADGTIINLEEYGIQTAAAATEEDDSEGEVTESTSTEEQPEQAEAVNAPAEDTLESVIAEGEQDSDSIAEEVVAKITGEEQDAGDEEEVAATETTEGEGESVAEIEPAAGEPTLAELATELAAVEPAAGDAGTPGASGRGGFGFDSSTDAVRSSPLDAIGPINPTQLQYGIDNQIDDLLFFDPLEPPLLTVNNGLDDAVVKEDGSIFVPITAELQGPGIPDQILTVTISGVDAATAATGGFLPTATPGVFAQTLPAGTDYNGGITVTPDAQTDVDLGQFSVIATASNPSTGEVESVSDDATVITDAVADEPEVDGVDGSTFVNNALDVDIIGSLGDDNFDGSETITGYTLTSTTDLSGFTFSAGTYDVGTNTLTLDQSDLMNLQVTPPADFIGSIDLEVTIFNEETNLSDTEVDTSDNTNSATDEFTLSWVKGPEIVYEFSAQVDGDTGLVKEDGSLSLFLNVDAGDPAGPVAGDEILTVTLSGIDPTWAVNLPGQSGVSWVETSPGTFAITLPAGEDYSGAITFEPPADSDVDHPQIDITATVFDPVLMDSASDDDAIDIVTDAVADEPEVDGDDASTFQNNPLDVDIVGSLGSDTDGSETITGYTLTSTTDLSGFTFSAGTYDAGTNTLTLDQADLTNLQVTPPTDFVGSIDLEVTIFNEETNLSDTEVDLSDNTNSATDEFTLTWVGGPVITYEFSAEVDGDTGLVKEDSFVTMDLNVENVDNVGPVDGDEVLTIVISNLETSWNIDLPGQSGASWVETSPGTFAITLPAGESYNQTLTFTPPADSDEDHPVFTISASVYDPELDLTESDSATADILTDAVIDTPTLNVTAATGEEGTSIPLDISAAIGETADFISESITSLTISGLPAGATLNNGTYDVGTDTWTLELSDLTGLEVNVPDGVTGVFNLIVSVTSEEDVQAGDDTNGEVDFTDNTETVTKTLKLTVEKDDVPVADPDPVTVDEENFPGILSQTGDLNIDFGDDDDGATVEVKPDEVPEGLKSAGQDVTVVGAGNTYTGTNEDNQVVFTFTLNGDGTYTYQQFLPLDHAEGTATDDSLPIDFCIKITDGDGDSIDAIVTVNVIDDNPVANDDVNSFDSNARSTDGNVITGDNGPFDTTTSDTDDLSNDVDNTVVLVEFDGDTYPVSDSGPTVVDGEYGQLVINSDGSYTYTLYDGVEPGQGQEGCVELNPTRDDLAGTQDSITLNDITISIGTPRPGSSVQPGGDLIWFDDGSNQGIGINGNGNGNGKIWPQGEVLIIDPAQDATKLDLTISEIGNNNAGDPLSVLLNYTDGTSETLVFNAPNPAPADGVWEFTVDAGDKEIDSAEIFSEPGQPSLSFLLQDVKAYFEGEPEKLTDEFVYTLQDFDGDTDTATLTFCAEDLIDDQPEIETTDVEVDETNFNLGNLTQSGTVTANFGADGPGTITPNGTATVGLLSAGQLVVIAATANGYEGKNEDGDTVLTFTLNGDGTYTYEQILPLDHPDTTNPDDAIEVAFGIVATDENGDTAPATITVTVKDDGPVANDDNAEGDGSVITGNVITGENGGTGAADELSEDVQNTVTEVNGVPVSETGTTEIIGANGVLEIDAEGNYTYTANPVEPQTVYCFKAVDPKGSDRAGNIDQVDMEYNTTTNQFTFTMQVDETANGFTVAVNGGPNPKGHGGELALIYFDASGSEPVITTYAYNGLNTQTSYKDGSAASGQQPADKILSSLVDPDAFANISVTDDGNGNKIMSFTVDASIINAHDPAYGPDGDWTGLSFGEQTGIWLHPVKGLETEYGNDGFLTDWSTKGQSWYDTSYQDTIVKTICPEHVEDEFTYTLTDQDGDSDTATLDIKLDVTKDLLLVGENVDDVAGQTTPWREGNGKTAIIAQGGDDILVGDVGGSVLENRDQDYNFLFILDVSGSMNRDGDSSGKSKLTLLKEALTDLMNEFADYQNGDIRVHFAPFATLATAGATFTITNATEAQDAIDWIDDLSANGFTNYESALQSGIEWLQSDAPLDNAITTTYFLSDGRPNRYVNTSGEAQSGNQTVLADEIDGDRDGSDELTLINTLSDDVISIGIDVGSASDALNSIDQDDDAIIISDPSQLSVTLAGTNPLNKLNTVGDDDIRGEDGDDIIFGDSLNTDFLAASQGLTTNAGAGWTVFEKLENGEGADATWDRDDTLAYIFNNAIELSEETLNEEDEAREGGNDVIDGGAGDDLIFGQEGDDVINGGAGADVMYGGTGSDRFVFNSDAGNDNEIGDFNSDEDILDISDVLEGYDVDDASLSIADFVQLTESGDDTIVSVDKDGLDNGVNFENVVILRDATGLDLEDLQTDGNLVA